MNSFVKSAYDDLFGLRNHPMRITDLEILEDESSLEIKTCRCDFLFQYSPRCLVPTFVRKVDQFPSCHEVRVTKVKGWGGDERIFARIVEVVTEPQFVTIETHEQLSRYRELVFVMRYVKEFYRDGHPTPKSPEIRNYFAEQARIEKDHKELNFEIIPLECIVEGKGFKTKGAR